MERRREQTSRHCIASLLSRSFSAMLHLASHLAAMIWALSRDSMEVAVLTKGKVVTVKMKLSSFMVGAVSQVDCDVDARNRNPYSKQWLTGGGD